MCARGSLFFLGAAVSVGPGFVLGEEVEEVSEVVSSTGAVSSAHATVVKATEAMSMADRVLLLKKLYIVSFLCVCV